MLDIIRAVSAVIAIVSATRLRFAFGVVCGLAIVYGMLGATLSVVAAVRHGSVGGEYALGLIFLGPSAVPASGGSPLPGSTWMATHQFASFLASATLAAVPCAWAWNRSTKLSPHSPESRRWDTVLASFLLLTVIAVVRLLLVLLSEWFSAR
jgi:hypothetical protein